MWIHHGISELMASLLNITLGYVLGTCNVCLVQVGDQQTLSYILLNCLIHVCQSTLIYGGTFNQSQDYATKTWQFLPIH